MIYLIGQLLGLDSHLLQGPKVSKFVISVDGCFEVFEFSLGLNSVFNLFVGIVLKLFHRLFEERVLLLCPFELDLDQTERLIELTIHKFELMNAHGFFLVIISHFPEISLKITLMINNFPQLLIHPFNFFLLPIDNLPNNTFLILYRPQLRADMLFLILIIRLHTFHLNPKLLQ